MWLITQSVPIAFYRNMGAPLNKAPFPDASLKKMLDNRQAAHGKLQSGGCDHP